MSELGIACDFSESSPDKDDVDELLNGFSDSFRVTVGKF